MKVIRFVKFYPGLAKVIEERLSHEFLCDANVKKDLEKILDGILKKDSLVFGEQVLKLFDNVENFDINKYIHCFLEKNDIHNTDTYFKLQMSFFDYVNRKKFHLSETDFKKIGTDLTKQQINLLPLLNFRRIEYILDENFDKYIEKRHIPVENIVDELRIDEKEEDSKMYKTLRYLSNNYNFGYKYEESLKNFELEKEGKERVQFYYEDGSIFYGKKEICDFYYEPHVIAKKINNFYKKIVKNGNI